MKNRWYAARPRRDRGATVALQVTDFERVRGRRVPFSSGGAGAMGPGVSLVQILFPRHDPWDCRTAEKRPGVVGGQLA